MNLDPDFSDNLVDLVKTVSGSLSDNAESLLREDSRSLLTYLGSENFLDDLIEFESSLKLDSKVFFFILMHQLKRKYTHNEAFRRTFRDSLTDNSEREWNDSAIRGFLQDQQLIIYLVNMLDDFVETEQLHSLPVAEDQEFHYVFEMIEASRDSSDTQEYRIFCHIGNYSLYLTGVFPDWIRYRHEYKNRPMDVEAYSDYGKTYFNKASKHKIARRKHMQPVLNKLSEGYDLVRTSLELLFKRIVPAFQ